MKKQSVDDFASCGAASVSRRSVLRGLAAGTIASLLDVRRAAAVAPAPDAARSAEALRVRLGAARFEQQFPIPAHVSNGDEARYPNRIASFSKGLPHDGLGHVDPRAYESLLTALGSGNPADFERIVLGGSERLVNPQAGLAFELQGADAQALATPPAPAFDSAEEAAEIAENYWMALARDVQVADYGADPIALRAAADLSRFPGFRGPRVAGRVTAGMLFRGITPGDLTGPYLSQFLLKPAPLGAEFIDRRIQSGQPGVDYGTEYSEWLALQNGNVPAFPFAVDDVRRYIRSGRDLAAWVRSDVIFQAYIDAMLVLHGFGAAINPGNPYQRSRTQRGFGTFGEPHMASALCAVTTRALKAVWFQKWFVHRRLRPEAFAGRIHNHVTRAAAYPIHPDILNSPVLAEVSGRTGTYLLPLAYPEGSPLHPAYGAGHATVAGACVTVLKAFFDETAIVPEPVEATPDGLSLRSYAGGDLTVGGELNKLASNIAFARNFAGVHWRSDAIESLRLGEEVALRFLGEDHLCFNEEFAGFTLTRFDGTRVSV
jgi:membrane-associated phospholipid phosphatase